MEKRQIIDFNNLKFEPFDNYGVVVPGMSWHKISYNRENGGQGTYVLKMEPGAKSLPHEHKGFEEFLMLDGDLSAVIITCFLLSIIIIQTHLNLRLVIEWQML